MAMLLASRFSEILKTLYCSETVYLKYIQPYLVVPLYKQLKPYIFEIEELFEQDIEFAYFNRPNGDFSDKNNKGD